MVPTLEKAALGVVPTFPGPALHLVCEAQMQMMGHHGGDQFPEVARRDLRQVLEGDLRPQTPHIGASLRAQQSATLAAAPDS